MKSFKILYLANQVFSVDLSKEDADEQIKMFVEQGLELFPNVITAEKEGQAKQIFKAKLKLQQDAEKQRQKEIDDAVSKALEAVSTQSTEVNNPESQPPRENKFIKMVKTVLKISVLILATPLIYISVKAIESKLSPPENIEASVNRGKSDTKEEQIVNGAKSICSDSLVSAGQSRPDSFELEGFISEYLGGDVVPDMGTITISVGSSVASGYCKVGYEMDEFSSWVYDVKETRTKDDISNKYNPELKGSSTEPVLDVCTKEAERLGIEINPEKHYLVENDNWHSEVGGKLYHPAHALFTEDKYMCNVRFYKDGTHKIHEFKETILR